MPRHIKTAALAGTQDEADAKTRTTVEAIIAEVKLRGDAAVRELSERFDKWSPPSFRLEDDGVGALVAKRGPPTLDELKLARPHIRSFAMVERAALKERQVQCLPRGALSPH